jgi:hypothetical protein
MLYNLFVDDCHAKHMPIEHIEKDNIQIFVRVTKFYDDEHGVLTGSVASATMVHLPVFQPPHRSDSGTPCKAASI